MTDLRQKWDALVNDPERPVAEYVEHERALQEHEGEKLTRLKIMTRAQEIRTWFLKLPMADRKIFLDVLTADEDGAMTRMFSLQATVESKGVDDDYIEAVKPGVLAPRVDGVPNVVKAYTALNRVVGKQKLAKQLKQKMLEGSRTALPPGRTLTLPGKP